MDDAFVRVFLQAAVAVDEVHHVLRHGDRRHVDRQPLAETRQGDNLSGGRMSCADGFHRGFVYFCWYCTKGWWCSPVWLPPRWGPGEPSHRSEISIGFSWSVWSRLEKPAEAQKRGMQWVKLWWDWFHVHIRCNIVMARDTFLCINMSRAETSRRTEWTAC